LPAGPAPSPPRASPPAPAVPALSPGWRASASPAAISSDAETSSPWIASWAAFSARSASAAAEGCADPGCATDRCCERSVLPPLAAGPSAPAADAGRRAPSDPMPCGSLVDSSAMTTPAPPNRDHRAGAALSHHRPPRRQRSNLPPPRRLLRDPAPPPSLMHRQPRALGDDHPLHPRLAIGVGSEDLVDQGAELALDGQQFRLLQVRVLGLADDQPHALGDLRLAALQRLVDELFVAPGRLQVDVDLPHPVLIRGQVRVRAGDELHLDGGILAEIVLQQRRRR